MPPNIIEKAQREQMIALGLCSFETGDDCRRRLADVCQRVVKFDLAQDLGDIAGCTIDQCAELTCREGCPFASRRRRYETISSAHAMLQSHPGPFYQVTVVHPRWELAVGALADLNIPAMRQWNSRALTSMGIDGVIAAGITEVTLNVELSGAKHWAPEIQQVVAGASREALKKAFLIERHYRHRKHQTPVMVSDVGNLGRQLGYAQKTFVSQRRAYISSVTGRQARRKLPPGAENWAEHDAWLLWLPLGARTIAYGCVRRGQKLYPLS